MSTIPRVGAGIRAHFTFFLAVLGLVALFAALSAPYVVQGALQYTGTVTSSTTINGSQASAPVSFYLNPGTTYNFYTVRQVDTGEAYAIVSTLPLQVGSRVFVNSSVAQWYINSAAPPISAVSGTYDRLIIAASVRQVSPGLVSDDSFFSGAGAGGVLSALSALAPVVPFLLVVMVKVETGRWALWSVVLSAWLYTMLPLASDLVGADYGRTPSTLLAVALVALPVLAYITSRLEVQVRARLATKNSP